MFTIATLTFYRLKEHAFVLLCLLGLGAAWLLRNAQDTSTGVLPVLFPQGQAAAPFGVVMLLLVAVILAVFIGAGEIPRDIATRFASLLLSKPLRRWEYVTGRALGVFLLSYGIYFVWILALFLFHRFGSHGGEPWTWAMRLDALLAGLVLAPVACCAVACSCFLDDIPVMILAFLYCLLAYLVCLIPVLAGVLPPLLAKPLFAFYCLFPNPVFFLIHLQSAAAKLCLVPYSLSLAGLWLLLALPGFSRRDLA